MFVCRILLRVLTSLGNSERISRLGFAKNKKINYHKKIYIGRMAIKKQEVLRGNTARDRHATPTQRPRV